jgi:hypothetical protein
MIRYFSSALTHRGVLPALFPLPLGARDVEVCVVGGAVATVVVAGVVVATTFFRCFDLGRRGTVESRRTFASLGAMEDGSDAGVVEGAEVVNDALIEGDVGTAEVEGSSVEEGVDDRWDTVSTRVVSFSAERCRESAIPRLATPRADNRRGLNFGVRISPLWRPDVPPAEAPQDGQISSTVGTPHAEHAEVCWPEVGFLLLMMSPVQDLLQLIVWPPETRVSCRLQSCERCRICVRKKSHTCIC